MTHSFKKKTGWGAEAAAYFWRIGARVVRKKPWCQSRKKYAAPVPAPGR